VARVSLASGSQEIPAARVVPEAAPEREHLVLLRVRERRERREAGDEPREVRHDRRHLRLLQHHLGEPDAVRIRTALREPPRQVAVARVVPGEEPAAQRGVAGRGGHGGRLRVAAAPGQRAVRRFSP
jgi:hypothetical protein